MIDIIGLSNNRKLQQTKEKERLVAAASLYRGRAICARMIAIFLYDWMRKKGLILKGYFRDFNKNFIKPKSIPSHSSQFWGEQEFEVLSEKGGMSIPS